MTRTAERKVPQLVVGYIRASTDEQYQSGLGLDAQRHAIAEYCEARGLDLVKVFDEGHGASGTVAARKGLDEALAYVEMLHGQGKASTLAVLRLDRLSRTLRFILETVDRLESWGCAFVSIREQYDTSHYTGRAMMSIFGAVAEMEVNRIRERTRESAAEVRRQGRRSGPPPFGLRPVEGAGVMPIPQEMAIVQEVWRLYYINRHPIMGIRRLFSHRCGRHWARIKVKRMLRYNVYLPLMPRDIQDAAIERGMKMPDVMEGYYQPFDPKRLGILTEKGREATARLLGTVV